MVTNPNEWLKFSDNVIAKPFKYGFIGAVSSALLLLMNHYKYVNINDFGFYFLPAIYIVFVFSAALIFWGATLAVFLIIKITINKRIETNKNIQNNKLIIKTLFENLDRTSREAKLLFLQYLKMPSGRFIVPDMRNGHQFFSELYRASLVNPEYGHVRITGPYAGEHCRVNHLLYHYLKETDPEFHDFTAKYLS